MIYSVYEQCALSIIGDPVIISIDGGAGTGKSYFIRQLLKLFADEQFQYAKTVLVCGVSVASIDRMARDIMRANKIGVRYKTGANLRSIKMISDAKIVFTTLEDAIELSA